MFENEMTSIITFGFEYYQLLICEKAFVNVMYE